MRFELFVCLAVGTVSSILILGAQASAQVNSWLLEKCAFASMNPIGRGAGICSDKSIRAVEDCPGDSNPVDQNPELQLANEIPGQPLEYDPPYLLA